MCRLTRCKLLAQHRHDLFAEDVDLLKHRLERQARMVHEEQLTLVVPEEARERERLLDDLLRTADRQRSLRLEVLKRRTMAIHRRIVEVGPKFVDGILRVLAHERLATEADDGLVGIAVAIVRETLPVQVDQPDVVLLGPEDVVGEEPIAVVRRLLRDFGAADRTVPDERRHPVERARHRGEALERRTEFAFPADDFLVPEAAQQVVVLNRKRYALSDVLAEPRVDRRRIPAAHHEIDAAVGKMLERRIVFRDLDRIVRRDQCRRRREDQSLGLSCDVRERRGGRRGNEWPIVVLASRKHVEADLFGLLGDRDGRLDALMFGRLGAVRGVNGDVADGEDSELHHSSCMPLQPSLLFNYIEYKFGPSLLRMDPIQKTVADHRLQPVSSDSFRGPAGKLVNGGWQIRTAVWRWIRRP